GRCAPFLRSPWRARPGSLRARNASRNASAAGSAAQARDAGVAIAFPSFGISCVDAVLPAAVAKGVKRHPFKVKLGRGLINGQPNVGVDAPPNVRFWG